VQYSWPGNIREMQNVIERAVILSTGPALHINLAELKVGAQRSEVGGQKSNGEDVPLSSDGHPSPGDTLADAERQHILSVLRETRWVVGGPKGAAARLGIKRTTLQWKMKQPGISRPG